MALCTALIVLAVWTLCGTVSGQVVDNEISRNGRWARWTPWSSCTDCGRGMIGRYRSCSAPAPSGKGLSCYGMNEQRRQCFSKSCPDRNGGWNTWEAWSMCYAWSCGRTGRSIRVRTCTNPRRSGRGRRCRGYSVNSKSCTRICELAKPGAWQVWGPWNECVADLCGGTGKRVRRRTCTRSSEGGACVGSDSETVTCTGECGTSAVTVNGKWSAWSAWGSCSVTCGTGKQYRQRKCDNPAPSGKSALLCYGYAENNTTCTLNSCPNINGGWSSWTDWSMCYADCDKRGYRYKQRLCNNPWRQAGGKACSGYHVLNETCYRDCINEKAEWSLWGSWGACDARVCAVEGTRRRYRACADLSGNGDGKNCSGNYSEIVTCTRACPTGNDPSEITTISSTASTLLTTKPFVSTTDFITLVSFKTIAFNDPSYNGSFTTVKMEPTTWLEQPNDPGENKMTTYEPTPIQITEKTVSTSPSTQTPTITTKQNPTPTITTTTAITYTSATITTPTSTPTNTAIETPSSTNTTNLTSTPMTTTIPIPSSPSTPTQKPTNSTTTTKPFTTTKTISTVTTKITTNSTPRPTTTTTTTPKPTTTTQTSPKATTTNPLSPQSSTTNPTTTKSTTPTRTTTKPTTTNPFSPKSSTPVPTTLKPTTPKSTTLKPTTPKSTTLKPTMPTSTTPDTTGQNEAVQVDRGCPTGLFTCAKGSVTCIQKEFVCDCTSDCDDGSDESKEYAKCETQCRSRAAVSTPTLLLVFVSVCLHVRTILVGHVNN